MDDSTRDRLGRRAERLAERFLRRAGLRTLARRYTAPTGELDLVMRTRHTIVFVEVKSLTASRVHSARDRVSTAQQRRLARTARWFLRCHRLDERPCRFDFVAITWHADGGHDLEYLPDAFRF